MAVNNRTWVMLPALGAVIAVVAFAIIQFGGTETKVTLRHETDNSPCVVTGKETEVPTKRGKKVTWEIDNKCTDKNELVTLGNFRTTKSSSARDCTASTEGGAAWPFDEKDDLATRQGTSEIKLKVRDAAEVVQVYYYDICTGPKAERKSDPRLVIEE